MRYQRIAPGPQAAGFVDHYWLLETAEPDAVHVQRVVPDGSPELILNLGQAFESCVDGIWRAQPRCFVAGQITGPLLLRPAGPAMILGVHFHPHGLTTLLGIPASELTGKMAPLDDLSLYDLSRDLAALGAIESVSELEARLVRMARTAGDPMVAEAVRQLAASNGGRDIASLARDFGMSTRHVERRFLERVGLTPKVFSRMRRFQSVFAAIETSDASWAATAIACGYYDQAHLIRDFREFAGEPPASLLASDDLARHFLSHRTLVSR